MTNKEIKAAGQPKVSDSLLWSGFIAPLSGAIIFGVLRYALDLPLWLVLPVMLITFYGVRVFRRVYAKGNS